MAIHRLKHRFVDSVTRVGMYADGGGLYLQVGKGGGAKSWIFRYHPAGRGERHMGLGPTHTISLDEARELARACRQQRLDGIDPIEARKAQKIAAQLEASKNVTFADCAATWIELQSRGWAPSTTKGANQVFRDHVNPKLGNIPVNKIDVRLVCEVLEPLYQKLRPTAFTARMHIAGILDWAKAKGFREGDNPASWQGPIKILLPDFYDHTTDHHSALPFEEIGRFMASLRAYRHKNKPETWSEHYTIVRKDRGGKLQQQKRKRAPEGRSVPACLLEFIILTAVRSQQGVGLRWDEIDMNSKIWTCPWQRTKTGKKTKTAHVIPLSEPAMAILEEMQRQQAADGTAGEYVFVRRRSPYIHAGVRSTAGSRVSIGAAYQLLRERLERPDLSVHGFRTTFSSWAKQNGYAHDVREMALDHVTGNKVERIYSRDADLLEPRRQLMEAWAAYCGRTEPLPADVIPIRQAK
jgi:integrase